jgi:hypothetical protein
MICGWNRLITRRGREVYGTLIGHSPYDVDPIQHQHVEMRIEIQRTAEALDKGHRVALDVGVALRSGLHR